MKKTNVPYKKKEKEKEKKAMVRNLSEKWRKVR